MRVASQHQSINRISELSACDSTTCASMTFSCKNVMPSDAGGVAGNTVAGATGGAIVAAGFETWTGGRAGRAFVADFRHEVRAGGTRGLRDSAFRRARRRRGAGQRHRCRSAVGPRQGHRHLRGHGAGREQQKGGQWRKDAHHRAIAAKRGGKTAAEQAHCGTHLLYTAICAARPRR